MGEGLNCWRWLLLSVGTVNIQPLLNWSDYNCTYSFVLFPSEGMLNISGILCSGQPLHYNPCHTTNFLDGSCGWIEGSWLSTVKYLKYLTASWIGVFRLEDSLFQNSSIIIYLPILFGLLLRSSCVGRVVVCHIYSLAVRNRFDDPHFIKCANNKYSRVK